LGGRGLDINDIGRVINFHLPKEMENYLHRVGRTARAGKKGEVVNLITERDQKLYSQLGGGIIPKHVKPAVEKPAISGKGKPSKGKPIKKGFVKKPFSKKR
jgi:superfamily II DNA/RNA helicase